MSTSLSVLDMVRVASPCPIKWDTMAGDERVRHCSRCNLHVFNLSAMQRAEAESLIQAKQGRLCARYYQRADGTVMTQDCPEQSRLLRRRRIVWALGLFLTLWISLLGWLGVRAWPDGQDQYRSPFRRIEPFRTVLEWLDPTPPMIIGVILCPIDDSERTPVDPPSDIDQEG